MRGCFVHVTRSRDENASMNVCSIVGRRVGRIDPVLVRRRRALRDRRIRRKDRIARGDALCEQAQECRRCGPFVVPSRRAVSMGTHDNSNGQAPSGLSKLWYASVPREPLGTVNHLPTSRVWRGSSARGRSRDDHSGSPEHWHPDPDIRGGRRRSQPRKSAGPALRRPDARLRPQVRAARRAARQGDQRSPRGSEEAARGDRAATWRRRSSR